MPGGTYSANDPSNGEGDPGGNISLSNVAYTGRINGGTEPTAVTVDFSLRYRLPFGSRGWYATLSFDAFNLLDRVNFSNVGSTTFVSNSGPNSSFLIPTGAFPMRQMQLGVKFTY